jgi:hypothetical protein
MSYIGVSLAVSNSRPIGSPSLSDLVGFWDADTANVVYVVDNGGLDARKTSGNEQWGDSVSVTSVTLTSVDQYEIDIEVVTKDSGQYDNFGILITSAVGTVPGGGYLSQNSGGAYARQPESSLSNGDIVTIRFDGPNSELKVFVNNVQSILGEHGSFQTTFSIDNTQSYYFTINNYKTGSHARIREEIYAPAAGFTKIVART